MVYELINPSVWTPEKEDDAIEGTLMSIKPSKKFANQVYELIKTDGAQIVVFGTSVLDNRMSYVKEGEKVKIVFRGVAPNKNGQETKLFDVFKEKSK